MGPPSITTRPLTPKDWKIIQELFGENGACGGCWCMYWRVPSTGKYWEEHKGNSNRASFKALVKSERASGVLAFKGDAPIGWCSAGPRTDFAYLARTRKIPPAPDENTWSITCFFIARQARNHGVAGKLLSAAVKFARARKTTFIEGYPTAPKSRTMRLPDAFAHTGVPGLFDAAGFKLAARAGARAVYRLKL